MSSTREDKKIALVALQLDSDSGPVHLKVFFKKNCYIFCGKFITASASLKFKSVLMSNSECCICLEEIAESKAAGLDSCSHRFCLDCIRQWSTSVNVCPVDRIPFHRILPEIVDVENSEDVPSPAVIAVEDTVANDAQFAEDVAEDAEAALAAMICETCHSGQSEHILLLCDGCNLAYHTHCLKPPLSSVPRGNWYCSDCSDVLFEGTRSNRRRGLKRLTRRRRTGLSRRKKQRKYQAT